MAVARPIPLLTHATIKSTFNSVEGQSMAELEEVSGGEEDCCCWSEMVLLSSTARNKKIKLKQVEKNK